MLFFLPFSRHLFFVSFFFKWLHHVQLLIWLYKYAEVNRSNLFTSVSTRKESVFRYC
jgi:hypothetical protein